MYLLIQPTDGLTTPQRQRLQDRIEERLEQHSITPGDADISQAGDSIRLEAEEETAPDLVAALARTPGIDGVIPCIRTDKEPSDITAGIEDMLKEDSPGEIETNPPDSSLEDELRDRLETVDEGATVTVYLLDDAYLATRRIDGTGGTPIDRDRATVVPLRDRLDVYAAYLLMQQGHSITPVYTDSHTDRVQEGVETLQAYDPGVKLAVIEQESWEGAVDRAVTMLGAEYIGLGDLPSEDNSDIGADTDATVKRPLPDLTEAEALDRYWEIIVPGDL